MDLRQARAERHAILYETLVRSPEIYFEAGDHVLMARQRQQLPQAESGRTAWPDPSPRLSGAHDGARGQAFAPPGLPLIVCLMLDGYRVRCRSCHHFWTAVSMSIAQTASAVTSNPTTTAFVVGLAWSE